MDNLETIYIKEKDAYEFIKFLLHSCMTSSAIIQDAKFHHETRIEKIPSMINNGILSKDKLAKLDDKGLSHHEISIYSDDYHVNGLNYVSVSSMELDFSTMGKDEFYWDPFTSLQSGIVISKDIKACRVTKNYFNEFLVEGGIHPNSFKAIDTKVLKVYTYRFYDEKENRIDRMLRYYHTLKYIAYVLKESRLDIPLREVSDEIITLNPQKVLKLPNLRLK